MAAFEAWDQWTCILKHIKKQQYDFLSFST
jgi:hypothetical protein